MADIPARDRKESRISALIKRAYGRTRDQLIIALGDPPDARNIPDSLLTQIQEQVEADLRDAIAIVLLLQMRAITSDLSLADESGQRLTVDPERAGRAAARYAARRARRVSIDVISTYRDRIETASREARDAIETARRAAEQAETLPDVQPEESKRVIIENRRNEREARREMRRRIKEIEREQAETIGATETTNAGTAGEQQYRKQVQREFGVLIVPTWVTERDERVCPVCQPLDGTGEAEWGEKFRNGPPAHPRCRCVLRWEESFVLEGA